MVKYIPGRFLSIPQAPLTMAPRNSLRDSSKPKVDMLLVVYDIYASTTF